MTSTKMIAAELREHARTAGHAATGWALAAAMFLLKFRDDVAEGSWSWIISLIATIAGAGAVISLLRAGKAYRRRAAVLEAMPQ